MSIACVISRANDNLNLLCTKENSFYICCKLNKMIDLYDYSNKFLKSRKHTVPKKGKIELNDYNKIVVKQNDKTIRFINDYSKLYYNGKYYNSFLSIYKPIFTDIISVSINKMSNQVITCLVTFDGSIITDRNNGCKFNPIDIELPMIKPLQFIYTEFNVHICVSIYGDLMTYSKNNRKWKYYEHSHYGKVIAIKSEYILFEHHINGNILCKLDVNNVIDKLIFLTYDIIDISPSIKINYVNLPHVSNIKSSRKL